MALSLRELLEKQRAEREQRVDQVVVALVHRGSQLCDGPPHAQELRADRRRTHDGGAEELRAGGDGVGVVVDPVRGPAATNAPDPEDEAPAV